MVRKVAFDFVVGVVKTTTVSNGGFMQHTDKTLHTNIDEKLNRKSWISSCCKICLSQQFEQKVTFKITFATKTKIAKSC